METCQSLELETLLVQSVGKAAYLVNHASLSFYIYNIFDINLVAFLHKHNLVVVGLDSVIQLYLTLLKKLQVAQVLIAAA